jgi:hypothetical protein
MGLELHTSSNLRQTEQTLGVTMSIIFFCVSEEIIIAGKRETIHSENPAGFSECITSLFSRKKQPQECLFEAFVLFMSSMKTRKDIP